MDSNWISRVTVKSAATGKRRTVYEYGHWNTGFYGVICGGNKELYRTATYKSQILAAQDADKMAQLI